MSNLGVQPTGHDDNGYPTYDLSHAVGRNCAVQIASPRKNKKTGELYTGDMVAVFGLEG